MSPRSRQVVVSASVVLIVLGLAEASWQYWDQFSRRTAEVTIRELADLAAQTGETLKSCYPDDPQARCEEVFVSHDAEVQSVSCLESVIVAFYPRGWDCRIQFQSGTSAGIRIFVWVSRTSLHLKRAAT